MAQLLNPFHLTFILTQKRNSFMRISFGLLLFILSFASCSKSEKSSSIETKNYSNVSLSVIDNLSFALDSVTSSFGRQIQYYEDDTVAMLAFQNEMNNEIIFFNFENRKQIKKITFKKEGPKSIGKIAGFHMINPDSIIVVSNRINQIYYFNFNGDLINQLEIRPKTGQRDLFPLINPVLPFLTDENELVIPLRPDGLWGQIKDFNSEPVAAFVNSETGGFKTSEVTFPEDYYKNGFSQPIFSRIKSTEGYVYSFYNDHNLFKTTDHQSFEEIPAKSEFVDKLYGMKTPNPSMEEYLTWLSESPAYLGLLYDPYRELIYRFVKLKYSVEGSDDLHKTNRYPGKLSIMIFDENLKLIGEKKLKKDTYYWKNSFVTRDGLYLNTNNPHNKAFTSERLSFDLFTVREK